MLYDSNTPINKLFIIYDPKYNFFASFIKSIETKLQTKNLIDRSFRPTVIKLKFIEKAQWVTKIN